MVNISFTQIFIHINLDKIFAMTLVATAGSTLPIQSTNNTLFSISLKHPSATFPQQLTIMHRSTWLPNEILQGAANAWKAMHLYPHSAMKNKRSWLAGIILKTRTWQWTVLAQCCSQSGPPTFLELSCCKECVHLTFFNKMFNLMKSATYT